MSAAPTTDRGRWRRLVPIAFVTYSLAYLDRTNFGIATASGMAADLGIDGGKSSLLGAMFFLGYFIFQVPGTVLAERMGIKPLVFACLLVWGAMASLSGWVGGLGGLLAVRFVLGAAEAAVLPAMLVYLNRWFTREERSRASSLLILGNPVTIVWMSVLSAYLVRSLGWRWMFIIEGLPALAWAGVWWVLADERPADARWLGTGERHRLAEALDREQQGLKPVRNLREAFRSPVVLCLCAQYFCWSLGIYGFVLWLPSILRQASSYGIVRTGWLAALPYLVAIPAMMANSAACDRSARRVRHIWPFLAAAALAFYGSYALGPSHFPLSFALLTVAGICMYAPYGPFFALMPELFPRNVAGGAMALVNSLGGLGGFAGAYLVGLLGGSGGDPSRAYALMSVALLASAALIALVPGLARGSRTT
ncbi:MAG TPA: MFS transporter [Opitutaceae bacterium]